MKSVVTPHPVSPRVEASCGFGGLRFEEIDYAAGLYLPTHAHDEAFLDFCLQGTTREFWDDRTFVSEPLTLKFLPIGAPHASRFQENVRTLQIVMNASWLERVSQTAPFVHTVTYYSNGIPTWIAARLYREFQNRDDLSPLALEGMLLELLAEMSRRTSDVTANDRPRWLRQVDEFLRAHFTESISMDSVATAVGVHPSHLMRSFRQHYRCTIGDYVRRLRIEYACHLLATSDASSSQVAIEAGFADQSHFNRTFKDCMSMTPVEFRKISGRASRRQKVIL